MRLTVIGCSPAWPNPGGVHSGYLVEGPGRLLLDCGPGVLARLREREAWPELDAIAITHLHLDHAGDLVPWVWGALFAPLDVRPEPLQLWLPPDGYAALERTLGEHVDLAKLEQVFTVREYSEREPLVVAGFDLTAYRLSHYDTPAWGLRIGDGRRILAYSGDTGPTDILLEVARDADLFLCEASLDEPENDDGRRGHLTAAEAIEAADGARAARLLVVHRPDELPLPDGVERAHDGWSAEV
jgi:ribonuclease BN (tRNA processing enzyme)